MGFLDLFRQRDDEKLMNRLDDIEELLRDLGYKTDDKFEAILSGVDTVMPHEKGQFINRLEERLITVKRDMILTALLAECAGDPKSYPEIRRGVGSRTGLNFSRAFLDSCMRRLSYEGRLERIGSRFISVKKGEDPLAKSEEHAIVAAIARNCMEAEPKPTPFPIRPRIPVPAGGGGNPPAATMKLEKLQSLLKLVGELEKESGSVPVDAVLSNSQKYGIEEKEANDLLDEHLMITGQLYEPKEGHVKLVRPI